MPGQNGNSERSMSFELIRTKSIRRSFNVLWIITARGDVFNSASQRAAAKDGELDCHYETEFYQKRCSRGLGTRK